MSVEKFFIAAVSSKKFIDWLVVLILLSHVYPIPLSIFGQHSAQNELFLGSFNILSQKRQPTPTFIN